jgi:thymidylate kinase
MKPNPFHNKLIVFEGIDLTGKSTNCDLTEDYINNLIDIRISRTKELEDLHHRLTEEDLKQIFNELENQELPKDSYKKEDFRKFLTGKRKNGAVRFEDFQDSAFNFPQRLQEPRRYDERIPIIGLVVYLKRLRTKMKVINALLPHVSIVCDRYYQSIIARAVAAIVQVNNITIRRNSDLTKIIKGLNRKVGKLINILDFEIIQPDLTFVLTLDEEERAQRLKRRARDSITYFDRQSNRPGEFMNLMEQSLFMEPISPQVIIDCTRKSVDQLFEEEIKQKIRKLLSNPKGPLPSIPPEEAESTGEGLISIPHTDDPPDFSSLEETK